MCNNLFCVSNNKHSSEFCDNCIEEAAIQNLKNFGTPYCFICPNCGLGYENDTVYLEHFACCAEDVNANS